MIRRDFNLYRDAKMQNQNVVGSFLAMSDQMHEQDMECRQNPRRCLKQILVDLCVIVGAWWLLTWLSGESMDLRATMVFGALYVGLGWLTRAMNLEFQDKFNVAAGFQLGYKLFTILSGGGLVK